MSIPVRGGNVKTFRRDHRLQQSERIQVVMLFFTFSVLVANPI